MLKYTTGDLIKSDIQTLTCTTNTHGAMGAGLAKQFKQQCPHVYKEYRRLFEQRELAIDKLHTVLVSPIDAQQVLLFPTKQHWKDPTQLEWVEANLHRLSFDYRELGITALALPLLGCGLGGLDWHGEVEPLVIKYFEDHPLPVTVFLP